MKPWQYIRTLLFLGLGKALAPALWFDARRKRRQRR